MVTTDPGEVGSSGVSVRRISTTPTLSTGVVWVAHPADATQTTRTRDGLVLPPYGS